MISGVTRPIPGGLNFEFTGERGFYGGFKTPVIVQFSFTGETGERGFFNVILSNLRGNGGFLKKNVKKPGRL